MRDILKNYKIFNIDAKKLRSRDFFQNTMNYRQDMMRKFRDAINKKVKFQCPVCKSKKGKDFLNYKNYKLKECLKCSLVSPVIDFSMMGGHNVYDDKGYINVTVQEIMDTYHYRKKKYATERLNYILEKIDMPKEKIRLLDLGCGPGYFVSHLKDKGIKYKGLELADFLVDICKKKKLNVTGTELKDEKDKTYNVITMFDVIEHLTDPMSLFNELNRKLMPGGSVLAYTPNIHSVAYKLMGQEQNTLYPFEHLCFFDEKSLNYLAKQTGFKVYSIDYYGLDIMDYFCMKLHKDNHDYLEKLNDFIPIMQAIIDKQGLSNHMRVIFKKA